MQETTFYVLGVVVVLVALVLSAVGLRREGFPGSRAALVGTVVLAAGLVIATGAFAWMYSAEHQRDYAPGLAEERDAAAADRAAAQREMVTAAEGQATQDGEAQDAGDGADGAQVFDAAGCGGCHTLAAAGSTAAVGPDLDEVLPGQSPGQIETSIVDPEADPTPGFPSGLMPSDYGDRLSDAELEALVQFLVDSTS